MMTFTQEINLLLVSPDSRERAEGVIRFLGKKGQKSRWEWRFTTDFKLIDSELALSQTEALILYLKASVDWEMTLSQLDAMTSSGLPILVLVDDPLDLKTVGKLILHGVEEVMVKSSLEPAGFEWALLQTMIRHRAKLGFAEVSQSRFREIIEGNSDGMLVVDESGMIVFANPAVGNIFEVSLQDIIGKMFDFYVLTRQRDVPSQDLENLSLKYISLLSTTGNTTELEVDHEKGDFKTIEMKSSRIPWQGQNAYLVQFHDMTQAMKLQRLKAEIFERERVARLKDEFISTVSHEIRTPLAIVKCAIENMRDGIVGGFTDKQNRIIKIASSNVDRLTKLIDDILDLSKLEAGKISMQIKPSSLNKILDDCVQRFKLLASERNIRINTDIPFNLPVIYADPDRITQVLDNLIGNALKFAHLKVKISVRQVVDFTRHPVRQILKSLSDKPIFVTPLGGVELIICDDGPGVPEDKRQDLFNKFVQLDRPDGGSGYKGTGLGLSICKEIIEMHHGAIWVDGKSGEGARFHMVLPEKPQDLINLSDPDLQEAIG